MSKTGKIILIILSVIVALIIGGYLLIVAFWNGTFNFMLPKEIATYNSPDGEYSLVFEQMGDPAWPFGPTDVRLTLKNQDGKIIERISTQLFKDRGRFCVFVPLPFIKTENRPLSFTPVFYIL